MEGGETPPLRALRLKLYLADLKTAIALLSFAYRSKILVCDSLHTAKS
jgi:hypothetical protein